MRSYDEAFVTGCDYKHEWFLEWFLKNYKKHVSKPLIFANFGLSESGLQCVKNYCHAIMDMTVTEEKGWFKKPITMLKAPSKKTVWIDLDCEIREDIGDIFNLLVPFKLNMVEDLPWSIRGQSNGGHKWHNSGVVGFIDKPPVLYEWVKQIKQNPRYGDQEMLHMMLNPITKMTYINDLPNEYNVVRLQVDTDGYTGPIKVMHWTGAKGKIKIRSLVNG